METNSELTPEESRPAELVKRMISGDMDDTNYGAALRELDAIAAQAREADQKYGEVRKSIGYYFPKLHPDKAKAVDDQMAKLDQLYAERRHKLAQIRYALHYRWMLRKAGIKPEDVAHRHSSRVDKPGQMPKVVMTEVVLKDGRRVKLEPIEIPRELLKL